MDAGSLPSFDLFAHPFRMLRVDPEARDEVVDDAFDEAARRGLDSANALGQARAAIVDPAKRLYCELSYLTDSPPENIDALYVALSHEGPADELLSFSEQLAPLSRANFLAHLTAHQPASGALLTAFVESHASIDPTRIYEILRVIRRTAGYPGPSLTNVNRGLAELLDVQIEATMARYETTQDMTEPVQACTEQILALGEDYPVEVLSGLLSVYRRYISPHKKIAAAEIEPASQALQRQPTNPSLLDALMSALGAWLSLCRPLILLETYYGRVEQEFEVPFQLVRDIIAELTARRQYDHALRIARLTTDVFGTNAFGAKPPVIEELHQDIRVIEGLSVQVKIGPFQHLIAQLERDPAPLVAALQNNGFAQTSTAPASALWAAFLQALAATQETKAVEPWRVIRNLAMRLNHNLKVPDAASALLAGLLKHAEQVTAAPEILAALRKDLDDIQHESRGGISPSLEAVFDVLWRQSPGRYIPAVNEVPGVSEIPSKTSAKNESAVAKRPVGKKKPAKPKTRTRSRVAIGALCGAIGVGAIFAGLYLGLFRGTADLTTDSVTQPPALTGSTQQGSIAGDGEIAPPVGRGQQFTLGNVRYCHFQEERLKIMKPDVRGPEALRAFNLLVVDYNSRCSDFLYRDADVAAVDAELKAKRPLLEADAKRIMAGWSGRGSPAPAVLPR